MSLVLGSTVRLPLAAAAALLVSLGAAAPAQAARLVVTGHDADHHCQRDAQANRPGSCRFLSVGVNYVRGAAPDPSKPVLVLDRGPLDAARSLAANAGGAPVPTRVVDPRSAEFAALPLRVGDYSAIVIASSKDAADDPTQQDLNEIGSTPDTDAINARASDIAAFFDAGGGIFVNSGGAAGRANSAAYYRFLNITRGGRAVTPALRLTAIGRGIGWQDARVDPSASNDINCCETHVSFEAPAPESPLKVAETDRVGRVITLVAQASKLANIEEPPAAASTIFEGVFGSSTGTSRGSAGTGSTGTTTGNGTGQKPRAVCVPRRGLRISLKRPTGVRFSRVVAYVNGKVVRRVNGRRLGSGRRTKAFTIKLSTRRTSKVRIVARTASGRTFTYRQTYKPCR